MSARQVFARMCIEYSRVLEGVVCISAFHLEIRVIQTTISQRANKREKTRYLECKAFLSLK